MMVVNSTHDKISYDTTERGNRENPQQAVFCYITEIRHAKIAYHFLIVFPLDSPVYTPEDSQLWQMAKHVLQVADYAQTQIVEHLFKIHLYMEPICVCVHRRLSKLHPLHQLLKHHCRGLLGTNALGHPFLMAPGNGSIDKLMLIGQQGAMTMMRRAYNDLSWEKTDFLANIKVGAELSIWCFNKNFVP